MTKYRSATLALAAGAAILAVTACSSASSSASSSSTPTASGSASASSSKPPVVSSPVPTTGPSIPASTVAVKGKIGSFPIPAAAKVGENLSGGTSLILIFGLVTPADVARFYATALPQAGYTVTSNALVSQGGQHGALVQFTGKGYKGNIESVAQFPGASIAGLGATNVTTVELSASS